MLSVDPAYAKPHAVARWSDTALLVAVGTDFAPRPEEPVVIEDQFIGPRNPGSALKVAKSAAWLIGYWRGLGHEGPTKWVPPSTWKRKLCGGPAPKQKSMRLCDYRVHETVLASLCDEEVCVYWHAMYACGLNREARLDVCDAVGIGLWYLISSGRRGILS